jgi:hypothetical protein
MAVMKIVLPESSRSDGKRETKDELQKRTRYEVRIRNLDGREMSRRFRTEADASSGNVSS